MALSPFEIQTIDSLKRKLDSTTAADANLSAYYHLRQQLEQLGMAVPPEMRRFLVMANWPRVVVDTPTARQQVRELIIPGEDKDDPTLRDIWDGSNLSAHLRMFIKDARVYGRALMSVGANEDDPSLPLVRVESPREMSALFDYRLERVTAAARFYGRDEHNRGPLNITLYMPNYTVWVSKNQTTGQWMETHRNVHNLGRVPVVLYLHNRDSGMWDGESDLIDIIPLTDAVARSLTNLQFAQEAHGVPRVWMTGVAKGDFVGEDGKIKPRFQAYYDAIHTLTNPASKVGQLSAADLKNFETAMQIYGKQASIVTGFPGRVFGLTTTNPNSEGSIVAEDAQLNRHVEDDNEQIGMALGWVGGLALRFATGEWPRGNKIKATWFDVATPTVAQRMDATVKAYQAGIISREGAWDELGWPESRKEQERQRFEAEATDPVIDRVLREFDSGDAAVGA